MLRRAIIRIVVTVIPLATKGLPIRYLMFIAQALDRGRLDKRTFITVMK